MQKTPTTCGICRLARAKAEAAALQEQVAAAQRALREERDARGAERERSDLLQAFARRSHGAMAALVCASFLQTWYFRWLFCVWCGLCCICDERDACEPQVRACLQSG